MFDLDIFRTNRSYMVAYEPEPPSMALLLAGVSHTWLDVRHLPHACTTTRTILPRDSMEKH